MTAFAWMSLPKKRHGHPFRSTIFRSSESSIFPNCYDQVQFIVCTTPHRIIDQVAIHSSGCRQLCPTYYDLFFCTLIPDADVLSLFSESPNYYLFCIKSFIQHVSSIPSVRLPFFLPFFHIIASSRRLVS
jgi:hypothetical protein